MDSIAPNFEGFVVPENEASSQIRIGNEQEGSNNLYVAMANNMPFQQSFSSNSLFRSNVVYGENSQMMNMPSPNARTGLSSHNFSSFAAFQPPIPPFDMSIGYGGVSTNIRGIGEGRGVFTSTQLMELQNQTYIYKYIAANVPVPTHLLTPLRNYLYPHVSPAAFYSSSPLRWGSPRQGYGGDPEPGRCRRTDGKKWRCSKDAVTDQKYCERHMNRGRQRARKAAEAQKLASPAPTTTPVMSATSSALQSAIINVPQDFINPDTFANKSINVHDSREEDRQGVSVPMMEERIFACDSFVDPASERNSFLNLNEEQEHDQTQFIDVHWDELKSDNWTSSDYSFMSSSSTLPDQAALSPLTLSQEIDHVQAGLTVTNEFDDLTQTPTNWLAFHHEGTSSPHNAIE